MPQKGALLKPLLHSGFDHTYAVVSSPNGYEDLAHRGFNLAERVVEHPGGVQCRFIYFPSNFDATLGGPSAIQYLEFVRIPDMVAYIQSEAADRTKQGLLPRTLNEITAPGFSLISTKLEERWNLTKPELSRFEPAFEHRNYAWKTQSERGPGWNYLKFGRPLLPFVETWVTEYDSDPSRESLKSAIHPNGCQRIIGCIWKTNRENLAPLARLGAQSFTSEFLEFADGFKIWYSGSGLTSLPALTNSGDYRAVILQCDSLAKFKQFAKPDQEFVWNGREAVLIDSPEGWALVVVSGT